MNKEWLYLINEQKDSGLAAVELAIIAPIFLVLIFSVLELGIIVMDKALLSAASREAARSGVAYTKTPLSDSQIKIVGQNYASHLVNFGSSSTNVTVSHPAADSVGSPLRVTISFTYHSLVLFKIARLFIANAFPATMTIQETTTMYMEQ
jgi:Flp pilus assembly protein TadG